MNKEIGLLVATDVHGSAFHMINESADALPAGVLMRMRGTFVPMGVKGNNGRWYDYESYNPHVDSIRPAMARKELLGENEHPIDRAHVDYTLATHRIEEVTWEPNTKTYVGVISILDTIEGRKIYDVAKSGTPMYVSHRALGTWDKQSGRGIIMKLITWDLTSHPSFSAAQFGEQFGADNVSAINESTVFIRMDESALTMLAGTEGMTVDEMFAEKPLEDNDVNESIETPQIGWSYKGTTGVTKDKTGKVVSQLPSGDGYNIDFGNGDIYGIMTSRIEAGEFELINESTGDIFTVNQDFSAYDDSDKAFNYVANDIVTVSKQGSLYTMRNLTQKNVAVYTWTGGNPHWMANLRHTPNAKLNESTQFKVTDIVDVLGKSSKQPIYTGTILRVQKDGNFVIADWLSDDKPNSGGEFVASASELQLHSVNESSQFNTEQLRTINDMWINKSASTDTNKVINDIANAINADSDDVKDYISSNLNESTTQDIRISVYEGSDQFAQEVLKNATLEQAKKFAIDKITKQASYRKPSDTLWASFAYKATSGQYTWNETEELFTHRIKYKDGKFVNESTKKGGSIKHLKLNESDADVKAEAVIKKLKIDLETAKAIDDADAVKSINEQLREAKTAQQNVGTDTYDDNVNESSNIKQTFTDVNKGDDVNVEQLTSIIAKLNKVASNVVEFDNVKAAAFRNWSKLNESSNKLSISNLHDKLLKLTKHKFANSRVQFAVSESYDNVVVKSSMPLDKLDTKLVALLLTNTLTIKHADVNKLTYVLINLQDTIATLNVISNDKLKESLPELDALLSSKVQSYIDSPVKLTRNTLTIMFAKDIDAYKSALNNTAYKISILTNGDIAISK